MSQISSTELANPFPFLRHARQAATNHITAFSIGRQHKHILVQLIAHADGCLMSHPSPSKKLKGFPGEGSAWSFLIPALLQTSRDFNNPHLDSNLHLQTLSSLPPFRGFGVVAPARAFPFPFSIPLPAYREGKAHSRGGVKIPAPGLGASKT